ncbi:endonuclease/exonuclease/phosphatase family protein [Bacillus sp. JJ1521]|uniref:endonuclease/exonuclease/phosphatase family protein n=1 Tax=Bacillus sp. JJ1521 TaxID=3122957 RepID=UPI002FFE4856
MKILTWNAAMKFREKIGEVLPLSPDILVIPECEAPEKWEKSKFKDEAKQFLWFGHNRSKGIGILSLNPLYKLELNPIYNQEFKYIVPIIVNGDNEEFNLIAVWSQFTEKRYYSYIGQIYLALKYYYEILNKPSLIIGDWNSNVIFDSIKRVGTHSDVLTLLKKFDIHSLYHSYFNEEQGSESLATHYFRKDLNNPFHIDYIFASRYFINRLELLQVGESIDWIKFSDHMPLMATFKSNIENKGTK